MRKDYYHRESKNEPGFKSKGEVQIARLLDRSNIAYQYEHPAAVVDSGKVRIWYPDFRLPQYGMIIEYFGVNGKKDYDEQAKHKMCVYKQNGIEGLFLCPSSMLTAPCRARTPVPITRRPSAPPGLSHA